MAKTIISLVIYIRFSFNYFSSAKNVLNMTKTVISLIICNNSKIIQKNNLTTDFLNTKTVQAINIVYNNI